MWFVADGRDSLNQHGAIAEPLVLRREAPIAYLCFNRPETRNALNAALWEAIPHAIAALEDDSAFKVIILTGVDHTAFVSGADLDEFPVVYTDRGTARAHDRRIAAATKAIENCIKPTLAMIQGPCVGGGCALALSCDLRFADTSARFAITPALLGLVYGLSDTRRLIDAVGLSHAKDMLFSGRQLKAPEALRTGLIDRLFEPDEILGKTRKYAETVAANSQVSIRGTKQIMRMIAEGARDDTEQSEELTLDALESPDFQEGRDAFMARRRPKFPYS